MQVEQYCAESGGEVQIVGYYHANERSDDHTLSLLAQKIGDKIQSTFPGTCVLLVGLIGVVYVLGIL